MSAHLRHAGSADFEDQCWRDIIPADVLALYAHYSRQLRAAELPVFYSTSDTRPEGGPKAMRATKRRGIPLAPRNYAMLQ